MSKDTKVTKVKLEQLIPHAHNLNKGTERGDFQLEASLKDFGIGRGGVLDKKDRIIAGNHITGKAIEAGYKEAIIVETTGDQLVFVKRMDLDLEDGKKAVGLALADNQVQKSNYEVDADGLMAEIADGLDVSKYFSEDELKELEKEGDGGDEGGPRKTLKLSFSHEEFEELNSYCATLMERETTVKSIEAALLFALRATVLGK